MPDFLLFFALVKIIHRGFEGLGWIMHRGLLMIPAQFLRNQVLFFDDKGLCMGALQLMHRGLCAGAACFLTEPNASAPKSKHMRVGTNYASGALG